MPIKSQIFKAAIFFIFTYNENLQAEFNYFEINILNFANSAISSVCSRDKLICLNDKKMVEGRGGAGGGRKERLS
jgi:hypothetical protein